MNREQAQEMADEVIKHGTFTSVDVRQEGGEFALGDDPWTVELWSVNATAGNNNLTVVREYEPAIAISIARSAMGTATKRDHEALARIEAARQMDDDD